MREKGYYNYARKDFHFTPKEEDRLDRIIFKYEAKPRTSEKQKKEFEHYLDIRGATFDSKREYAAMHNSLRLYNNICKQAGRKGFNFWQAIPLQVKQEVGELTNKMLPLTEGFQFNEEGWLYVYSNNATCLYVGQTSDHFPLREATSHLGKSTRNADWSNAYKSKGNITKITDGISSSFVRRTVTNLYENRFSYQTKIIILSCPILRKHTKKSGN